MREYSPNFGDQPAELPPLFPGGVPPEVGEQPDITISREHLAEGEPEPVHLHYPIIAGEGRGPRNGHDPAAGVEFSEPVPNTGRDDR